MRVTFLLLTLLPLLSLKAQAPREQVHHTFPARYFVHNVAVQAYLYHQIAKHIELSYDFEYVKEEFYHNNYLFHEPFTWAKPVWRKVSLSSQSLKPGDPGWSEITPFDSMLVELLGRRQYQPYKSEQFLYKYEWNEVDSMVKNGLLGRDEVILLEYWHQNIRTKKLERNIRAFAVTSSDGYDLMWFPFDEIRFELRNYRIYRRDKYLHYEDYFLEGAYPDYEVIKTEPTKCIEYYSDDDFGAEFDLLFEIEDLRMKVRGKQTFVGLKEHEPDLYRIKDKENNLFVHAVHGLVGQAEWIGSDGLTYRGKFEEGEATGKFEVYAGKEPSIEARFEAGNLEGPFTSFYAGGVVHHDYWFKGNIPDSSQQVFHPDGSLQYSYAFKEGEMEGPYERWTPEGRLLEKGAFKKGLLYGPWEVHFKFNDILCFYFKETNFQWTVNTNLDPEAFDDCTFDAYFDLEYMSTKGCPEGVCIIPRQRGMIR
jgi:hypothetical protein